MISCRGSVADGDSASWWYPGVEKAGELVMMYWLAVASVSLMKELAAVNEGCAALWARLGSFWGFIRLRPASPGLHCWTMKPS